ncbi:hypothetical protein OIU76_000824 [Salix suchowensis]|nr:hypothetical protein OIU76_000824 [Salix suchowensis]
MDPPPPSLSIPPPAPPSIPPPQPGHRHHHHNPHTHHQRNPPFSSSAPPYPHHKPSFLCRDDIFSDYSFERTRWVKQDSHSKVYRESLPCDATTTTATVSNNPPQIQPQLQQQHPQHVVPVTSAPPEQKRGRGRPPKTKANGLPPTPPMLANGQPQTGLGSHVSVTSLTQSQLVGIPADPASTGRKGRGRPKKVVVTEAGPLVKKGRGRPPNSGPLGSKKSTGRPRKPKSLVGAKKSPGRPPKNQLKPVNVPYAVAAPTATDAAAVFSVASPKPRGRPRKGATPTASATGAVVMVQAKQPGRPAQVPGVMKLKPRKSSGRPVGRPRKVNAVIFTRIRV